MHRRGRFCDWCVNILANVFQHSVGLGKKSYLVKELSPETIEVMKSVKRSLDPDWLLNPGKIMDY